MDTIKVLLSVTVALLLGALAISWKSFRHEQRSEPKDKLAEIQRQIGEIRDEREQLQRERERLLMGPTPLAPPAEAPVPETPIPDVGVAGDERVPPPVVAAFPSEIPAPPELAGPSPADAAKRAAAIESAVAVGKVTEWVDDPQMGAFATMDVLVPASVKSGTILCIRRNSGILGRVKVGEVTPDGAIASAVAQFGEVKPQAGDDLIVEPATR